MKYLSGRHKYPSEHGYDHLRTVLNTPLNVYKYPSGRSYNHLGTVLNTPPNGINPLKSRSPDVEASGLIIRRKGVDILPVASGGKGRKVRIRARVQ